MGPFTMPSLDLSAFRSRFPILERRVYVNTCSQGPLSRDVRAAVEAYLDLWDAQGSPWDRWVEEVEHVRRAFARWIGALDDEIAVVPSASVAIATIAHALDFTGARRRVVVGEFEFPTMAQNWLAQEPRGAEIRWAPASGDALDASAYEREIDERTLVVPVTHVCFRNGYRLDLPRIISAAHAAGAFAFVDDYQSSGTTAMDVHALGVDFLVTGTLKYLLGPPGCAFLYVRRDLVERLESTVTGWFGRIDPFAYRIDRLDWAASARRFEGGAPTVPNAYAARAGLDLLAQVGADVIEQQIARLTARFVSAMQDAGVDVVTPLAPERRGPLVVVRSTDAAELMRRLDARGIVASARGRGLRVAFHGYNTDDDVDGCILG